MSFDFPAEARLERAIGEVKESPVMRVVHEFRGPGGGMALDPHLMFETLGKLGYTFDAALHGCYFRYRNMALRWRARSGDQEFVGEFDVKNLVVVPELPVPVEDLVRDDSQLPLLSELFVLDDLSLGGSGNLSALRLRRGRNRNPEIWFLDRYHDHVRLDLNYCEYLDSLAMTKGAYGWQYLFAEVRLSERGFGDVRDGVEAMLELFPDEFPEYDYAPLRQRLEERL